MWNYRPEQFVVKTSVWVVAAMLALSPIASSAYGGNANTKTGCRCAVNNRASGKAVQQASCCSGRKAQAKVASSCCAFKKRAKRPCCSSGQDLNASSHPGCTCGQSCSCKSNQAPPPPAVPPTSGNTGSDQLAKLLAMASAQVDHVVTPPGSVSLRQVDWTVPATSLQRCIDLSCFLL